MNTNNEAKNLCEQMEQEFNYHEFYGLQYIVDDLFDDSAVKPKKNTTFDWYGLDDLNTN